ncbi:MAG: dephospho-CoA kinase [Pseudomonadota bacterium]
MTTPLKSQSRPPVIGLTGGIASGKTTVADLFAELGARVIDTDVIARQVVEPGTDGLAAVVEAFGEDVLNEDGELDRGAMRSRVFADDAARRKLEGLLHPLIQAEAARQASSPLGPYKLLVVPLLTRSPLSEQMDRIIVVDCDEKTQIARLMARDAESREQALRMLEAQASRSERLSIADDVITNNSTFADLRQQVMTLHESYLTI